MRCRIRTATLEIARLEWRLLTRNRSARYVVLTGPILLVIMSLLILSSPMFKELFPQIVYAACTVFPVSYALMGFSWNATNQACTFHLPVDARDHVAGRLLAAVYISIPPVIVLAGAALTRSPEFALLAAATGLFGLTVAVIPCLMVSARTPKSLDANAHPFADMKKFGWRQGLAGFAFFAPAFVLIPAITISQSTALIGAAGLVGLALLPSSMRFASRKIERALPALSERLRGA